LPDFFYFIKIIKKTDVIIKAVLNINKITS